MKKILLLSVFVLATLAHATVTAYAPPVGGMTTSAAATTDTLVSVTLAQPATWVGTAASAAGTDIVVNGSPSWSANQYASGTYYYARMLSGAQAGHFFSIVANGSGDLTVDNAGLDLSVIASGDTLEIVPYWTLGTFYPAAQGGTAFTVTTSTLSKKNPIAFL